jgi:hypothetical protein
MKPSTILGGLAVAISSVALIRTLPPTRAVDATLPDAAAPRIVGSVHRESLPLVGPPHPVCTARPAHGEYPDCLALKP